MRDWIEEQITAGPFGNASEYIRSLIREDQKRCAREKLEAKLVEGLESGPASLWTRKDVEKIKARLLSRHAKKKA